MFSELPSNSSFVFYQGLSSMKGSLPSKVVFHQRSSSIKDHLPSKVIFHRRSSSIKGHQVVYMHSPVLHFLQVDFCVVLLVDILVTGEKQSQPLLCTCPRALKKVKSVDSYQTTRSYFVWVMVVVGYLITTPNSSRIVIVEGMRTAIISFIIYMTHSNRL